MIDQTQIEKISIPGIKKIILVTSGKGGVGKSTVSVGLALALAQEGYSTGLLDADIFGPSIPTLFSIADERPFVIEKNGKQMMVPFMRFGIKVMSIGFFFDEKQAIIWRGPLVSNAVKQMLTETDWDELDYLIIDAPPGTGDILITIMQNFPVSGALVVTTPQQMALADVQKSISMLKDENIGTPVIGIVENMAWFTPVNHPEEKYYIFGQGGAEKLSTIFNIPVAAQIPINENICFDCDNGNLQNLLNDRNVNDAFRKLVDKVVEHKKSYRYINNKIS